MSNSKNSVCFNHPKGLAWCTPDLVPKTASIPKDLESLSPFTEANRSICSLFCKHMTASIRLSSTKNKQINIISSLVFGPFQGETNLRYSNFMRKRMTSMAMFFSVCLTMLVGKSLDRNQLLISKCQMARMEACFFKISFTWANIGRCTAKG